MILRSRAPALPGLLTRLCYSRLAAVSDRSSTQAANDGEFVRARHRTLAIPATVTPVANYPRKLRIYRTNASPYWQVRTYLQGRTYTQSLRTTHRGVALRAARDFFHQKVADVYGQQVVQRSEKAVTFQDLVNPTLSHERARVDRGELSQEGLRILRNRLLKTIEPFFGTRPVTDIGYPQVSEFAAQLTKLGHSAGTIQQHLVATRKVLNQALARGLIAVLPGFPSIKTSSQPRSGFTLREYRELVRSARQSVGARVPVLTTESSGRGSNRVDRYTEISADLQHVIVFMVNSFVRPSDIRNLQHQHVTVVRGEHTYLRLNLPESKGHDKPIVTLRSAVRAYERLRRLHGAEQQLRPTDYVFLPKMTDRRKALEQLGHQFAHVRELSAAAEPSSNPGGERPLYSLRHTAIMFRLLYGSRIDLLTLARNARTSVEMIERFYASRLTGEMNIDLLQSKRR